MKPSIVALKDVKKIRNRAVRSLNDQYVLTGLVIQSLRQMREDLKDHDYEDTWEFEVPNREGDGIVLTREYGQVSALLKVAYDSDVFKQSLIAAIAEVEGYLQDILRIFLAAYPEKLGVSIRGVEVEKKVPLDLILASDNKEQIVSRVMDVHLNSLFYAKPLEYFAYIENMLSIQISEEAKENYIEIKATRDIIVHNAGIANDTYAEKAGNKSRAKSQQPLIFNEEYFKSAIGTMKQVVISIYDACVKKHRLV